MESSKVCRLCLQNSPKHIGLFSETGKEKEITKIISQHFWFEPQENDNYSDLICLSCWDYLNTFHQFYNDIKKAQENLNAEKILHLKNDEESLTDGVNIKEEIKEETVLFCPDDTEFVDESVDNDDIDNEEVEIEEDSLNDNASDNKFINNSSEKPKVKEKNSKQKIKRKLPPTQSTVKRKRGRPLKTENTATEKQLKSIQLKEKAGKKAQLHTKRIEEDQQIREFFKLECQLCPEKMQTFTEITTHYRQVHSINHGYVLCCNRKLIRRCDLTEHLDWHLNPSKYQCSICEKVYCGKYALKLHMTHHTPEEEHSFKCDICHRTYATKGSLVHHLQISHIPEDGKMHKCPKCGKAFALKSILHSHIRGVHESYYASVCDICAKVFKSKAQCAVHRERFHSDVKQQKVQCSLCGSWLRNEKSLEQHIRRSHKNKPQSCKICGKTSPNKDALKCHMRYVHELKRVYKCDYCDKAFKQKINLKEHMASHTGAALYVCPYCPRTFNSNANMHSHRKNKHPIEWERDRNIRMGPSQA